MIPILLVLSSLFCEIIPTEYHENLRSDFKAGVEKGKQDPSATFYRLNEGWGFLYQLHLKEMNELKQKADDFFGEFPFLSKTLREGSGEAIDQGHGKILVRYHVFSESGETLHVTKPVTLELQKTLPAFAAGMQGAKKGEIREIFIHPLYAYGLSGIGRFIKFEVEVLAIYPAVFEFPPIQPVEKLEPYSEVALMKQGKQLAYALGVAAGGVSDYAALENEERDAAKKMLGSLPVFVQTKEKGQGALIKKNDRILISTITRNRHGQIVETQKEEGVDLTRAKRYLKETIPGLNVGEKGVLYLHPDYADQSLCTHPFFRYFAIIEFEIHSVL